MTTTTTTTTPVSHRRSLTPAPSRPPRRPRWRWWHAAAVGVAANLVGSLPRTRADDREFYASLPTPAGAPPGWLFAPVWAINNTLTLWSNLRVANLPDGTPGRRTALGSEAVTWALFAAFSPLYFGRRSPALGAADTVCGLATTAHAVVVTARLDPPAAWALAPRLAWLALASYVSTVTAVRYAGGRTRSIDPG
jgi:benzodiazapine receptor